jgi:hypothetical protein
MNRMQKMAWVGFFGSLTSSVLYATAFMLLLLSPAYRRVLCLILCPFLALLFAALVWSCRKQSPAEPDYDERDSQISRRAVIISFAGLCFLIYISDAIVILWTGVGGSIPTSVLPVIHLGVGLLTATLYYAAMLVFYGKGKKANG